MQAKQAPPVDKQELGIPQMTPDKPPGKEVRILPAQIEHLVIF